MDVKEGVDQEIVDVVVKLFGKYKYGWEIDIEIEYVFKGLNEDIVCLIFEKNEEFEWMIDWWLEVFVCWKI